MRYAVVQVTLKEKFIGSASRNLAELEDVLNEHAARGWRLHTISTASAYSAGLAGGDRIQATLVFERDDLSAINSDSDEQDVAAGPGSDIAAAIAASLPDGVTIEDLSPEQLAQAEETILDEAAARARRRR